MGSFTNKIETQELADRYVAKNKFFTILIKYHIRLILMYTLCVSKGTVQIPKSSWKKICGMFTKTSKKALKTEMSGTVQ